MQEQDKIIQLIGAPTESRFLRAGSYKIHYTVAGRGTPLLLIHGLNIGWGQWYSNIKELSQHFKVYSIDMPGAGLSSSLLTHKVNPEKVFVNTVDSFISQLGLKEVSIIGHSLGAWIAFKLGLKNYANAKKIILVSPVGFTDYIPLKFKPLSIYVLAKFLSSCIVRKDRRGDIREFLMSMVYKESSIQEEFIDYVFAALQSQKIHPFMLINGLTRLFKIRKELVLLNQISNLSKPVLIVVGEHDSLVKMTDVRLLHKLMPRSELKILPNAGHVPFIESSNDFNDSVISFLQKV